VHQVPGGSREQGGQQLGGRQQQQQQQEHRSAQVPQARREQQQQGGGGNKQQQHLETHTRQQGRRSAAGRKHPIAARSASNRGRVSRGATGQVLGKRKRGSDSIPVRGVALTAGQPPTSIAEKRVRPTAGPPLPSRQVADHPHLPPQARGVVSDAGHPPFERQTQGDQARRAGTSSALLTSQHPQDSATRTARTILRAMHSSVQYMWGLMRSRVARVRRSNPQGPLQYLRCNVPPAHVMWLALHAYRKVLGRKQARYSAVLQVRREKGWGGGVGGAPGHAERDMLRETC
jgi:hypothetical protein